ncbi:MAG: phytanoyl-CoA dioxygenase family protein [Planctomycetes bacterium]|nr:phytanoyl-CoA dioxygenase family protein [Planctomycetota bacterium]
MCRIAHGNARPPQIITTVGSSFQKPTGATMYTTHPHQVISDAQFAQLIEQGFLILPRYIRGEELSELQAAQRRVLRTWEQAQQDPKLVEARCELTPYPWSDARMSRLYLHPELVKLGQRFLKTEDVVARVGYMLARYPGFTSGDTGHIDNGNNSLLPRTTSAREYGQIGFWIHLDEVQPGQAPLLLVRTKDGQDLSKAVPFVCPEGSIAIFSNYTFHASSPFTAADGQRFAWGFGLGRADHHFEGLLSFTSHGQHPVIKQVVSAMTARERTMMHFPPPNHPYYTRQTLVALEEQYPGWNARGEYPAMDESFEPAKSGTAQG